MLRFKIFKPFQSLALFISGMGLLVWEVRMAIDFSPTVTLAIAFLAVAAAGSLLEAEARFWPIAFLVATLGLARLLYIVLLCGRSQSWLGLGFAVLLGTGFTLTAVLILAEHTQSFRPEYLSADHKR